MALVGLRELKNQLSAYVRRVRGGERIQVTDRGQVVAEIAPPAAPRGRRAGLLALERRGVLRPAAARGRARYPVLPGTAPRGTSQRLLDEERGAP